MKELFSAEKPSLKQIRCKNCESFNSDCEKDYETQECEVTLKDVKEWLQQKQKSISIMEFATNVIYELLEELR